MNSIHTLLKSNQYQFSKHAESVNKFKLDCRVSTACEVMANDKGRLKTHEKSSFLLFFQN